jgi:hypothetical protein
MKTYAQAAAGGLVLLLLLLAAGAQAVESVDPSDKLIRFMRTEHTPSEPLLPPGAAVKEGFEPGEGAPAGAAQIIKGTVLVLRKNSGAAFRLRKDMPVFAGDTLITEKDSRVTVLMQDNSVLSLAAQSKLVIDQAELQPEGRRDTKLKLLLGRVRAVVSKLAGKNSFTIRTPTLLAGVRGTDFAVAVAPAPDTPSQLLTAVLTGGGQSFVELISPAGGASTVLCPLSVASADESGKISRPIRVCWKAQKTLRRIAPEIGLNCGVYLRRMQ